MGGITENPSPISTTSASPCVWPNARTTASPPAPGRPEPALYPSPWSPPSARARKTTEPVSLIASASDSASPPSSVPMLAWAPSPPNARSRSGPRAHGAVEAARSRPAVPAGRRAGTTPPAAPPVARWTSVSTPAASPVTVWTSETEPRPSRGVHDREARSTGSGLRSPRQSRRHCPCPSGRTRAERGSAPSPATCCGCAETAPRARSARAPRRLASPRRGRVRTPAIAAHRGATRSLSRAAEAAVACTTTVSAPPAGLRRGELGSGCSARSAARRTRGTVARHGVLEQRSVPAVSPLTASTMVESSRPTGLTPSLALPLVCVARDLDVPVVEVPRAVAVAIPPWPVGAPPSPPIASARATRAGARVVSSACEVAAPPELPRPRRAIAHRRGCCPPPCRSSGSPRPPAPLTFPPEVAPRAAPRRRPRRRARCRPHRHGVAIARRAATASTVASPPSAP